MLIDFMITASAALYVLFLILNSIKAKKGKKCTHNCSSCSFNCQSKLLHDTDKRIK